MRVHALKVASVGPHMKCPPTAAATAARGCTSEGCAAVPHLTGSTHLYSVHALGCVCLVQLKYLVVPWLYLGDCDAYNVCALGEVEYIYTHTYVYVYV